MRHFLPAAAIAAAALLVLVGTAADLVTMTVLGCIGACVVAVAVTVEYLILVPLKSNPGAKRLVGLLVAIDLLLLSTIFRFFIKDFPLRSEVQSWFFWGLLFSLAYLGWHIWKDQIGGARAYRENHPAYVQEARKDHHR